MKPDDTETRTGADLPEETKHLTAEQKQALELNGEIEHETGLKREKLTREAAQRGAGKPAREGEKA